MAGRRIFFFYWVFLFLGAVGVRAQQGKSRIVWEKVPLGNHRFSVLTFSDYLSLRPEFLATKTSAEPRVELEFTVDKARWVRVTSPFGDKDLVPEAGKTYVFRVHPDGESYYVERLDDGLPPTDINRLCDSVNVLVNNYLNRYNTLLYSGRMARQTAAYCDSVEKVFAGTKDSLFNTFLHFRVDELRLLGGVWSEAALFKMRLQSAPFQPENPDYAYTFGEFYKGRLGQIFLKNKMAHAKTLIGSFRGVDTLTKLLAVEPFYPRSATGEGALLFGLTELLGNKEYSRDGILYLFNQMADSSRNAPVKKLARNLYKKYRGTVPGDPVPELRVEDKAGVVTEVPGKYNTPVYLCFFDPKSEVTAAELGAMIEMKKKLKERVALVPVIINAEKAELARMQTAQRLPFELYRNLSFSVLGEFGLKSDCTCMLVSPAGKYLMPDAPLPGSSPLLADRLLEAAKSSR